MLCKHCELVSAKAGLTGRTTPVPRIQQSDLLTGLLCERCSTVLPATRADDHLLKRLEQLSRFGIGAESEPILAEQDSGPG